MSSIAEDLEVVVDDGVPLHVRVWRGDPSAATLLYHHGIQSHVGWFERGGEWFHRERGMNVWAVDRRGAGKSGGEPGHMPSFHRVIDDLHLVVAEIRKEPTAGPVHGLGFSLAANFMSGLAIRHPGDLSGLVIVGPGIVPKTTVPLARKLRVLSHALFAPTTLFDIPIRDNEFTRDPGFSRFIAEDPLRTKQVSARFFLELLKMRRFLFRRASEVKVPLLAMLAGEDSIIDNDGIVAWMRLIGSRERRVMIYDGCLHSLQFEIPLEEFAGVIADWFDNDAIPRSSELEIAVI